MLQEIPENGVTLSSLRVRYAPFGESPRVLPRSGSSLRQPLRESERLARDGDDDTVHVKQTLVCASELRRSGSSLGVGGSTWRAGTLTPRPPLPAALCAEPPTTTRPSRRSRLASAPAQTGANLPVLKATHHHPSSTARSNRTRLLRVPHAPRGSRERGNSELPLRTLRSLRREPQSSSALRIVFKPTSERV